MRAFLTILFTTLLLVCLPDSLFSQVNNKDSLSNYLDDNGISTAKNIVKVNLLSIVNGDLPVYYENILSGSITYELGAGILLPYYVPELPEIFSKDDKEVTNVKSGYSLRFDVRFYYFSIAPEGIFGFVNVRRKHFYIRNDNPFNFTAFSMGMGIQQFISKRIMIDFTIGRGIQIIKHLNLSKDSKYTEYLTPLTLKIGYLF